MKIVPALTAEQTEIAIYHIQAALSPLELDVPKVVTKTGLLQHVEGLGRIVGEDFKELTHIKVYGGYGDWDYSETSFAAVFKVRNAALPGKWAALTGSCDYTGWGCQSGSGIVFGETLADVVRWGMDREDRVQLGLALDEDGE